MGMIPAFFIIALTYSLIGFGGGSSYLAFLALSGLPMKQISGLALICNTLVAAGGTWHFGKAGQIRMRMLWPFLLTSIPAAFLGGRMTCHESLHRFLLGICLLFVAWRIWIGNAEVKGPLRRSSGLTFFLLTLAVGGGLGFVAGFLGIGGGIFLSPVLIMAGWMSVKEASGAAALFILLNSISGLAAKGPGLVPVMNECLWLGLAVLIGGQIGSRMGAYHLPALHMRRILAGFITWVGFRLIGILL